jgi:threonine/homoserine/homoserine lactone efflux protein
VLTSLALMGTPGPATISLTAAGSAHGIRRCVGFLIGIIAGTLLVLLAVATGVTAVLLAAPGVRSALVVASAAYILWLAYHVATAPPLAGRGAAPAPSTAGGAFLGVANPKAWLAIAAVFASVHLDDRGFTDAAAKVTILSVMIVLINTAWLLAGASFAPLLRDARRARIVNVALALVLVVATAATLAG